MWPLKCQHRPRAPQGVAPTQIVAVSRPPWLSGLCLLTLEGPVLMGGAQSCFRCDGDALPPPLNAGFSVRLLTLEGRQRPPLKCQHRAGSADCAAVSVQPSHLDMARAAPWTALLVKDSREIERPRFPEAQTVR